MPTVFVAFGVTGDLMRQKILHDVCNLHKEGELPEHFEIIGVSRREWDDVQLRDYVAGVLKEKAGDNAGLDSFLDTLRFLQGDVGDEAVFEKLAGMIGDRSALLYIALSPVLYKDAFFNLVNSPLALRPARSDSESKKIRIMIEKPFGTSGTEADELNTILYKAFSEEQLYRVDHYVAKESLHAIFRSEFGSPEDIREIHLSLVQKEGVEKRGPFFDVTGALRDLGQNHMMTMLAIAVQGLASARAPAIEDLQPLSPQEVATRTKRAQYKDYRDVAGVAPGSQTETYFKIETTWRGIPVTFEGGKYMPEERKEVLVVHRSGAMKRFPIEPNQERSEHEMLVLECLHGNAAPFVSIEEIAAQWRFIDPIEAAWRAGTPSLGSYGGFAKN